MKNDRYLIILKGKDRTDSVYSWRYDNGRIVIRFNGGKSYTYSPNNVRILTDPAELDPKDYLVLLNNKPLRNIERIQHFGPYTRLIYKSGYSKSFLRPRLKIIESSLIDTKSKNIFEYLKEIAIAVSLYSAVGDNILGKHYSKIEYVRNDSILASYLTGQLVPPDIQLAETPVFPFGFNESQKTAVENAMNNRLSIIEGPPGTGKTQTILNIIANAIIRGQSVAVVSSNNSATANVLEKLEKSDLGFIAAFLGSYTNKEAFIKAQSADIPYSESWILSYDTGKCISKKLDRMSAELDSMLLYKNTLSIKKRELDVIEIEYRHFLKFYNDSLGNEATPKPINKLSAGNALKLWLQYEHYAENKKRVSLILRLTTFLRYGISSRRLVKLSTDKITTLCQRRFYEATISDLKGQIRDIEKKLNRFDFDRAMGEYSSLSMKLFKSAVGQRYKYRSKRTIYDMDDLWKNSESFIRDYPIILSTTYSLRSSLSHDYFYDYVIVDEASQVDIATGALALSCAKKAVIVGDLKQLPNVVTGEMKAKTNSIFKKYSINSAYRYSDHSLLSSVCELFADLPRTMLKEHYRCHPKIIEFCNAKFYDNQLIVLNEPKTEKMPLLVYKTVKGNHARERVNQRQIDVILKEVIPQQGLNVNDDSVGIVSPYRNHTNELQRVFSGTQVKADTVDKFQGREKDTIILCTVDNEISEFADSPNRLNVAVSRAINQLIVVTDGNISDKDSNTRDLVNYIRYNNFETIQSEVYSVFDYLYKSYANKRRKWMRKRKRISEYESENLMYELIRDVLELEAFRKYDVATHVPLKMIISDPAKLDDKEASYAMNILTHVDFLIFDKLSKQPVLVVEVDGYAYHSHGIQVERDTMKNRILNKYDIPYERFWTNQSGEKERLIAALDKVG